MTPDTELNRLIFDMLNPIQRGNEDLVCEWQPPTPQPLRPISMDCQLQAVRDGIGK